jgi:hypothetical protein
MEVKRGRTITKDIKNNKEYFNEYYREHNHDIFCECGQFIKSMCIYKHKKTKKHNILMEKKLKEKLEENLGENT